MAVRTEKWKRMLEISLMVVLIGSIWGVLEMTLGGFLHAVHVPQKGAIMGGLAVSLMAIFTAATGKPSLVPILGVIAASFKPIDGVILGGPLFAPYVVNPATAIILQALAFGAVAVILRKAMERRQWARAGAGFAAGASGYVLYALVASVFGLGMWATIDLAAKLEMILTTGMPIAIAGAAMMVGGYYAVAIGARRVSALVHARPRLYVLTSTMAVALCWVPIILHSGG